MGSNYEEHLWRGESGYLTLYLDDVSEIPFLGKIIGVEEYQHRARLRAGDGDLYAAVTPPVEGYEEYCRDTLRMGSPRARDCGDRHVTSRGREGLRLRHRARADCRARPRRARLVDPSLHEHRAGMGAGGARGSRCERARQSHRAAAAGHVDRE